MKRTLSPLRLKAEMVLRGLSLGTVAKGAGLNYTVASQILNGRLVDPVRLAALERFILSRKLVEVSA